MRLLTAHSDAYQPLADITVPNKQQYCRRWGIEFMGARHAAPVTCWQRPRLWLDALGTCGDWLFFTGTDVLITNHAVDVREFTSFDLDFIFAADGNGLQSDVWLMRNCPATRDLLRRVCEHEDKGTGNEQDALNIELSGAANYGEYCAKVGNLKQNGEPPSVELLKKLEANLCNSDVRVRIVPQRLINAYPHTFYGGTGEEPYSWHPGDFIAHMPGKSMEDRLKGFSTLEVRE